MRSNYFWAAFLNYYHSNGQLLARLFSSLPLLPAPLFSSFTSAGAGRLLSAFLVFSLFFHLILSLKTYNRAVEQFSDLLTLFYVIYFEMKGTINILLSFNTYNLISDSTPYRNPAYQYKNQ